MTTDSFNLEVTNDSVEKAVEEKAPADDLLEIAEPSDPVTTEPTKEISEENKVIITPKVEPSPSVNKPVNNNVVGSNAAKKDVPTKPVNDKKPVKTVAVFASRNISWQGVGKLLKGYTFVSPEAAEKWTTLNGVRLATPEEIKSNLG